MSKNNSNRDSESNPSDYKNLKDKAERVSMLTGWVGLITSIISALLAGIVGNRADSLFLVILKTIKGDKPSNPEASNFWVYATLFVIIVLFSVTAYLLIKVEKNKKP